MSNRTLIELNHDHCPRDNDEALLAWAKAMRLYMGSGRKELLPRGVTWKWMRRHTDLDPMAGRGDPS